jgi:alpha/beta superfamily hydrolase
MEKQVHFKNHLGEKLTGTLHPPKKSSNRGIIIGHCFTCSRHTRVLQQMGHDLAAARFTVLRFDFSGNGQSEGAFIDSLQRIYLYIELFVSHQRSSFL